MLKQIYLRCNTAQDIKAYCSKIKYISIKDTLS